MILIEKINKLIEYANKSCSCTSDQETGKDPSICKSCMAGHSINNICDELRYIIDELEKGS